MSVKQRLMICLAAGALAAAMVPVAAAAGNGPQKDHVTGSAKFDPDWHIWVSAHSDANGDDPRGRLGQASPTIGKWIARVTCLRVDGDEAAIGGVITKSTRPGWNPGAGVVRYVRDNDQPSDGPDVSLVVLGTDDCSGWVEPTYDSTSGNLVIQDN